MFASETILVNSTLTCLEISVVSQKDVKDKGCRWAIRDFIFTDRALYIFQEAPSSEPGAPARGANYLQDEYGKDSFFYKNRAS